MVEAGRSRFKSTRDSANSENYEWACFHSQQAGEKALKAYLYS
ncbi:HEPN domain-containing protein, partial [bacterium]|nr:HEPN domain-containing protein [bacterium]